MAKLPPPSDNQALPTVAKTPTNCPASPPIAFNGQTLEGILDSNRLPNSLIEPEFLSFASVPKVGSTAFKQSERLIKQFEDWQEEIDLCDEPMLDLKLKQLITALHQPPRRNFALRKSLPEHVAEDRRDPIALIVTAVQLLEEAIPEPRRRRRHLDVERFEYVYDHLREAELVQVSPKDIRFEALTALSATLSVVIAKLDRDCWACVETW